MAELNLLEVWKENERLETQMTLLRKQLPER